MGKRGEVAAGADGALAWNYRVNTGVKHVQEAAEPPQGECRKAFRQRVGAQKHHGS